MFDLFGIQLLLDGDVLLHDNNSNIGSLNSSLNLILNYISMALTDWLLAYWKLDESSGNAADATGNGNTWVNVWTIWYTSAKIGNGITNNGDTSKYLSCWTWAMNGSEFSFSWWIKTNYTSVGNNCYLFTIMWNNTNERILITVWVITSWRLSVYSTNKSPQWYHTGTTNLSDNNWHHVVVTISTSTITIYVDWNTWTPDKVVSASWSLPTTALNAYLWWRYNTSPTTFFPLTWTLDECGVWNRALTTSEVTELYNWWAGNQYPFTWVASNTNFLAMF